MAHFLGRLGLGGGREGREQGGVCRLVPSAPQGRAPSFH